MKAVLEVISASIQLRSRPQVGLADSQKVQIDIGKQMMVEG